jgi:uncharacterized sulfatase
MLSRSRSLQLLLGAAVAIGPLLDAPFALEPASRPNILWISCEDMSPDLGCYGDAYSVSPNVDRLAREGVRYTRVFGQAGVCAVNRSSMITAMYPTTIGTQHMRCEGVPPAYVKCFPELLRAAGYFTSNNAKTDYNFAAPPSAWDANGPQAHWRSRERGQPFFSVFNITTTHESQVRAAPAQFARQTARLKDEERHDPAKAVLPPYYPDTEVVRRDWARYYDLITAMDYQVGEILKELDADGLAEDTIVWFWSDHGRGLPRAKRWLYDSGLRVPLIVRFPGRFRRLAPAEAGHSVDDLVAMMDFGPTALSLAGVKLPRWMQGQAFLGAQASPPREYVFAARDRMDESYDLIRAVRDRRWKYIRNYMPERPYAQPIAYMDEMPTMKEWRRLAAAGELTGAQALFFRERKPLEELYDTESDPHEVQNLAESPAHQKVLEHLREAHEAWRRDTRDLGFIAEDILWEKLRPGGVWDTTAAPVLKVVGDGGSERTVDITCATAGSSIVYALGADERPRWKLYTAPLKAAAGDHIRAKACRLGFKDSAEAQVVVP